MTEHTQLSMFSGFSGTIQEVSSMSREDGNITLQIKITQGEKEFSVAIPQIPKDQAEILARSLASHIGEVARFIGDVVDAGDFVCINNLEQIDARPSILTKIQEHLKGKEKAEAQPEMDPATRATIQEDGYIEVITPEEGTPKERMIAVFTKVSAAIHNEDARGIDLYGKEGTAKRYDKKVAASSGMPNILIDLGTVQYRCLSQNPNTSTEHAKRAAEGAKITWFIRKLMTDEGKVKQEDWLGRIENGKWYFNKGVEESLEREQSVRERASKTRAVGETEVESEESATVEFELQPETGADALMETAHRRVAGLD